VGVGVGVGVGDSSGVGVGVEVRPAARVCVMPGVAVGEGVPVWVGVALDVLVALDVALGLGVGIPVDEMMVGPARRLRSARPQASRAARRASAPAPVKKRRRPIEVRNVCFEGGECLSVMTTIIELGEGNVKRARQTSKRRLPYAPQNCPPGVPREGVRGDRFVKD